MKTDLKIGTNNFSFSEEWNIQLFANDIDGAIKTLSILTEWAMKKVDKEIDYQNSDGHIICKKVETKMF